MSGNRFGQIYSQTIREFFTNRELFAEHWQIVAPITKQSKDPKKEEKEKNPISCARCLVSYDTVKLQKSSKRQKHETSRSIPILAMLSCTRYLQLIGKWGFGDGTDK